MSLPAGTRPRLLVACGELLALVERQREQLDPFDLEKWEATVRERDHLFAEIQGLEQASKHFNSDDRLELQRLIGAVLEHDQVIEATLGRAMASIQGELGELQAGSRAVDSYLAESSLDALFIDRSS